MGSWRDRFGRWAVNGLVLIFFSLFAVPGLVCGAALTYHLWMWAETGGWVSSSCWIDKAELETGHGEDGDLYKNVVRYHYEFQGRTYPGTRLALMEGASSRLTSHEKRHAELQQHLASRAPLPCLVNGGTPTESVLYRELEVFPILMLALFGAVFSWIGLGGFYVMFFKSKPDA